MTSPLLDVPPRPTSDPSDLTADGFCLLRGVFDADEIERLRGELAVALAGDDAGVRRQQGEVYAARNVVDLWPAAREVWHRGPLTALLEATLGPGYGLVRVLYFDKPPEQTWALPWHKDLKIAVKPPRTPSPRYSPVRDRAGVPHCEPPLEVLEGMLTLRLHLDETDANNGGLTVLPGSHTTGRELRRGESPPHLVAARPGDVLAMRPLLAHASGKTREGVTRHRRILHFEFAAGRPLPDGYEWHDFVPAPPSGS